MKAYTKVFPKIATNQNLSIKSNDPNNNENDSDEISEEMNDGMEEEPIQTEKHMKRNKNLSPVSSKPIKTEIELTEEMARKLNKKNEISISSIIKVENVKKEGPSSDSNSGEIPPKSEPLSNANFLNNTNSNNNINNTINNTPKMDANFLNQQNLYNYSQLQRNWDFGKLNDLNQVINNPYYYFNQAAMRSVNYQDYMKMYVEYIKSLQTKLQ